MGDDPQSTGTHVVSAVSSFWKVVGKGGSERFATKSHLKDLLTRSRPNMMMIFDH